MHTCFLSSFLRAISVALSSFDMPTRLGCDIVGVCRAGDGVGETPRDTFLAGDSSDGPFD